MNYGHLLTMRRPASWFGALWKEALPLGNGETGALVYGGVQDETVTLTRHDLWHWGEEQPLPDVHKTLEQSRQAMDKKDFATANRLLSDTLKEKGYTTEPATPFPLADLTLHFGDEGCFYGYRRELDMEAAEARISYQQGKRHFQRRCLLSRENGLLFYEVRSSYSCSKIEIGLHFHSDGTPDSDRMMEEQQEFLIEKPQFLDGEGWLFWRGRNEKNGDYGAVARIIVQDGSISASKEKVYAQKCSSLLILVKTFQGEPFSLAFTKYQQELSSYIPDYELHRNAHLPLHQALYHSCDLSFDSEKNTCCDQLLDDAYDGQASPELMEKLWHFGRYLFICGTAEGYSPFPLYGLWNGEYHPVWAQNVANENVQILYWHLHTGGLDSLIKPLLDYYWEKLPKMRENAQKLFGCRGIFVSTYTSRKNTYVAPVVPVITNWIGAAGWLCQHFFRYYQYTGDRDLMRQKILPFMIESARFYCDYVVRDKSGKIKIYPSVSPENSPANFIPEDGVVHLGHAMPAVYNATMDFAIIKELLRNLLSVKEEFPELCTETKEWQQVLKDIPPYQINEDGAIKEWMAPELKDFYCHRHLSHLYPVFPGNEVSSENYTLWKAFERAVDLRELGGQVGWSLVHMACIYARFGRSEDCANCIDLLVKGVTLPNLMMISNDYRSMGATMEVGQFAPIQLDANIGYVNALQEMLFHAEPGRLSLLPACPARLQTGSVRDFRFPGGRISFAWDLGKKESEATFNFNKDGKWTLNFPWKICRINSDPYKSEAANLVVQVAAGETISIYCKEL